MRHVLMVGIFRAGFVKEMKLHIKHMVLTFGSMLLISTYAFSADKIDKCATSVDHTTMRKCLEDAAKFANSDLTKAETKLTNSLQRWDEDHYWRHTALESFKSTAAAFQEYQKMQCDFEAATAAGGNSAGDLRLECIYRLAQERLKLLVELKKHFKD